MDPRTIATGVLTVLTPFLVEGGKAAAKKAGEALWAALDKRFQGHPRAAEALADMKAAPKDPDNQADLRKQVRKLAEADDEFRAELQRLLETAEQQAPGIVYNATLNGDGAIAQGDGAQAVGAGGVMVGGNVDGDVVTGNKTAAPAFDQRGQQVENQTNIAGDLHKK